MRKSVSARAEVSKTLELRPCGRFSFSDHSNTLFIQLQIHFAQDWCENGGQMLNHNFLYLEDE